MWVEKKNVHELAGSEYQGIPTNSVQSKKKLTKRQGPVLPHGTPFDVDCLHHHHKYPRVLLYCLNW